MDRNPANDNDELSFITLGAATANVVRYLQKTEDQTSKEEDHGADHSNDRASEQPNKQGPEERRRYIEQRLEEIAAFERSYSTGRKGRT